MNDASEKFTAKITLNGNNECLPSNFGDKSRMFTLTSFSMY